MFPTNVNTNEDLQPLELSRTPKENDFQETKFENEQSINGSNDSQVMMIMNIDHQLVVNNHHPMELMDKEDFVHK